MDPLTMMLIFGGLGAAKSEFVDKPAANRKRDLAAETQRLSPWTGMQAGPVDEPDTFGTALQFGATGAQMGQGMQQASLNKRLGEEQLKKMQAEQLGIVPIKAPATGSEDLDWMDIIQRTAGNGRRSAGAWG